MSNWRDIPSAPEWGRRALSASERRIVLAAVEAMLADGHGPPIAAERVWCERVVDSYDLAVGNCSSQVRVAIAAFLRALNGLPLVVIKKPKLMTTLSIPDRVRYLDALERHRWAPFTMLLIACKVPMLMPAFEQGEALAMTGFDRPHISARRQLKVITDADASSTTATDGENHNAEETP